MLHVLMLEFAVFDGSQKEFVISKEDLRDELFGARRLLQTLVVEVEDELVGFMNYFKTFGTFTLNHTMWVEDVYIQDDYRKKGYGKALFEEVKRIAQKDQIQQIEWLVRRDNNNGIDFYRNLGAKVDNSTIYVKWEV